jgi:hypothetical protein
MRQKTNWRKLMTTNPASNQNQNTLSIIAIVLGLLSFFFFWFFCLFASIIFGLFESIIIGLFASIIFGTSAIVLAFLAKKKSEKLSKVAFAIAIAGTAINPVIFMGLYLLRVILGSIF